MSRLRCNAKDARRAPVRFERMCVGEFGYARRERVNAQTAGLDPILTQQEASPAVTIAATPDLFATSGRV